MYYNLAYFRTRFVYWWQAHGNELEDALKIAAGEANLNTRYQDGSGMTIDINDNYPGSAAYRDHPIDWGAKRNITGWPNLLFQQGNYADMSQK